MRSRNDAFEKTHVGSMIALSRGSFLVAIFGTLFLALKESQVG
jgi:hypothetical protein